LRKRQSLQVHELSLVQGLFSQLSQLAERHGAERIVTVRVNIGRCSGIVIDSFVFGFDALKPEAPFTSHAVLEITEVDGADLILTQVEME